MKQSSSDSATEVSPVTDNEVAEAISAIVYQFPRKLLGKYGNRSAAAAKKWVDAKSAPSLATGINLARKIPQIKWLIYSLIEQGEESGSARFNTELTVTLLRIADGNGESAHMARSALADMHGGRE